MAGRMGGNRRTVQNLTIQAMDTEKGLLLISGAIPVRRTAWSWFAPSVKGCVIMTDDRNVDVIDVEGKKAGSRRSPGFDL